MMSLFRRKNKPDDIDSKVVFHEKCIMDVTNFNANASGDSLGYLCNCIVSVYSNGLIRVCSVDNENNVLESISVLEIIRANDNINNYDPDYLAVVSVITEKKGFRFSFESVDVKNSFWNALTSTYDAQHRTVGNTGHFDSKENTMKMPEKAQYTGLCCSATGVYYHSFRKDNGEVFSVKSMVVPKPDVTLEGFGKSLLCKSVDYQITLVPGVRRYIMDNDNICYGFYEFADFDHICAQIGEKRISILPNETGWSFSINSENDARINRIPEESRIKGTENGFDTEHRFSVEISDDIEPIWYPIIFGTPMLSF